MDGGRTNKRQDSEYSDFFLTQREPEYDQDTDQMRPARKAVACRIPIMI